MLVPRVDAQANELLDPAHAVWRRARASTVVLSPTPLDMQPTEYVRVSWRGRPYGTAAKLRVGALHNGKQIFFRLTWDDESVDRQIGDINQFVDAAAVMFPVNGDAPLFGMGTKGKPVNVWLWRADWERPKNVAAEGMGSTQRRDDAALASKAEHKRGAWQLVVGRSFSGKGAPEGTVQLAPGATTKVAFAIWQGGNQERAGIKAFSPDWQELEIEA